jgi:hypothetical protein
VLRQAYALIVVFASVLLLAPAISYSADDAAPDSGVVAFITGELAEEESAESAEAVEEPPSEEAVEETPADEAPSDGEEADEATTEEPAEAEPPPSPPIKSVPATPPEEPATDVAEGLELLEEAEMEEKPVEPPVEETGPRFFGPLPSRNQHPVHLMFFNFPAERARVLPPGEGEFAFRFDGASTMVKETENGTIVDLDLEGWYYQLEYRRGVAGGEIALAVPLRDNSHGFMDNIIDGWHQFFSLPRGDRPDYPASDYHFFVRGPAGQVLNIPSDQFGLADMSLMWKDEIARSEDSVLSYRLGVKLPTGDSDKGLGSGGTDFGAGLAYERTSERWATYANLNYIFLGEADFAGFETNNTITGALALEYRLKPTWWLTGQIDFAQYPLETGALTLDRDSVELLFGFHKLLKKRLLFSGGFSEDIRTNTAPDFGITGELRWLF